MAKRMTSFADDFKRLSETAENAVQLVREREQKSDNNLHVGKMNNSDEKPQGLSTKPAEGTKKLQGSRTPSKKKQAKPREWGKPVAILNTRIPEEMSELLDDLVYRLRKKGEPRSKQNLAKEAIQDLLVKHGLL